MEPPVHQYEQVSSTSSTTTFTYAHYYYYILLLLTCWLIAAWRYLVENKQSKPSELSKLSNIGDEKETNNETTLVAAAATKAVSINTNCNNDMDYQLGHYVLPPDYADGAAYYNPTYADESDEEDELLPPPEYTFLEPIPEETSDDLRSEESRSEASGNGHWGWDGSSMDGASVIHIDNQASVASVQQQQVNCFTEIEKELCVVDNSCKDAELDKWLEESIKELEGGGEVCEEEGSLESGLVASVSTDLDRRWSPGGEVFSFDPGDASVNNTNSNKHCQQILVPFPTDVGQDCQAQNGSRISGGEGQHSLVPGDNQTTPANRVDWTGKAQKTPFQNGRHCGVKAPGSIQRNLSTSRPLQNGSGDLYILFDRDKINNATSSSAAAAPFADWDDALDLYLNSRANATGGSLRRTASNEELISSANIDNSSLSTQNLDAFPDKRPGWSEAPAILFSHRDKTICRTSAGRDNPQQKPWQDRLEPSKSGNTKHIPSSTNPTGYDQSVAARDQVESRLIRDCGDFDEEEGDNESIDSWESSSNSSSSSSDEGLLGSRKNGSLRSRYVCQDLSQIDKFDASDQLDDLSDSEADSDDPGNYECFNGHVICDASLVQRSLSLGDLRAFSSSDVLHLVGSNSPEDRNGPNSATTRPSNENLSEDSGYCDVTGQTDSNPLLDKTGSAEWEVAGQQQKSKQNFAALDETSDSRKPFPIGVILEEPEVSLGSSPSSEFVKEEVICAVVQCKDQVKVEQACGGREKGIMGTNESIEVQLVHQRDANNGDLKVQTGLQKLEDTGVSLREELEGCKRGGYQPETGQFKKRETKSVTDRKVEKGSGKGSGSSSSWEDSMGSFNSSSQSWQEALLEREWERAMKSGKATTDDWLILNRKNQNSERNALECKRKVWRSLPSLKEGKQEEDEGGEDSNPVLEGQEGPVSAPASMLTESNLFTDLSTIAGGCGSTIVENGRKIAEDQEKSPLGGASRPRESASGAEVSEKGDAENPNWEVGAESVVPLDLALGLETYSHQAR